MKHFEERLGLHLTVLALYVVAVIAALVVEGLGLAVIVAIGLAVVLGIGYPVLVIMAEEHGRPLTRRRP